MSTLHVIGEFFHNWESQANFAAARDLTAALAETSPRGFSSALLIAADTLPPRFDSPKSRVEIIPLRSSMLPIVWHSNQAARPLDGEFVHTLNPLAPLRTRDEDDGSQASITVPHTLAWDAPQTLPKGQARSFRSFTRRALKHADIITVPTHAVAQRLKTVYGKAIMPRVLPLAAPSEYLAPADAARVRSDLKLPERYAVTNASPGEPGRLEWILRAYENNAELPHLIVVNQGDSFDAATWPVLNGRVTSLQLAHLRDMGAVLSGAEALLMPQQVSDTLYIVYGALAQGVPVVHADSAAIAEITLDGGVGAESEEGFSRELLRVLNTADERQRISLLASDRSRAFSWHQTAWQLWEIHANL